MPTGASRQSVHNCEIVNDAPTQPRADVGIANPLSTGVFYAGSELLSLAITASTEAGEEMLTEPQQTEMSN